MSNLILPNQPEIKFNLRGLSDEELQVAAPAIFATRPDDSVSEKYAFVPTTDVLPVLRDAGFVPTSASSRAKVKEFGRHRIEMFRKDDLQKVAAGKLKECPRIVIENSHDRTRRLVILAGYFRLVCSNGLIAASGMNGQLRTLHLKIDREAIKNLVAGTSQLLNDASSNVEAFKARKLTKIEQATYANYAAEARYKGYGAAPYEAKTLLGVRRDEDQGDDLWTVFNRVQENVVRGGVPTLSGRKSRGVTSFSMSFEVNRRLWAGAEALNVDGIRGLQKLRKVIAGAAE